MTRPDTQSLFNSAVQLHRAGKFSEAASLYNQVLATSPQHAEALHAHGTLLNRLGDPQRAVELIRRSVQLAPNVAEAHYNLAQALRNLGDIEGAICAYQKATELRPSFVEAWNNLGTLLKKSGRIDEAIAAFREAIALRPADIEPRFNLGNALAESENTGDAIDAYRSALAHNPQASHVIAALGNAYRESGRIADALDCYRRSLAITPDPDVASNLAYTLYLDASARQVEILDNHRAWDRQFAHPLAREILPHANDRSPNRRVRIGYVSPDFSLHPVGRFIYPLLSNHDPNAFEVFCYSDGPPDDFTVRIRAAAGTWRETSRVSHLQVADQIRADGIDVLVDLAMHTRNNRLLTFARKPAPIQISYLAYCGTTGLDAIDYRFADPYLDPPGEGDDRYSEKSIRLPTTYWCFQPLEMMPPVAPPPALATGTITFGYLGSFAKASNSIDAWLQILQSVPNSRLRLHCPRGPHRDRLLERAARLAIAPGRVEFVTRVRLEQYFHLFDQIDISLDTFHCSGATTLCDSLWMGVPVITCSDPRQTAMARSGLSVLSNAGFPELVAQDVDQYVQLAVKLANDLSRLQRYRQELRPRMSASSLMNATQFARDVESAVRTMWRTWCEGRP